MRRTESGDPELLAYQSGGGCVALLAVPFVGIGLALIALPFFPGAAGQSKEWAFVVGGLLVLGGLLGVLWRSGVVFDRRLGTATKWWGLFVPFWRTESRLSAFDHVHLGREIRKVKNSSYTVYPLGLGWDNRTEWKLCEKRRAQDGRQLAEEVAKFLGFRLVDESMGKPIVREAAELDESLRDRTRRTGQRPAVPDPPAGLRIVSSIVGDALSLELPPRGFTAGVVALIAGGVIFAVVILLAVVLPLLRESSRPGERFSFLIPLVGLLLFVPPLAIWAFAMSWAKTSFRVEVTPFELRVTRRGWLLSRTTAIPADQLEELEIVGEGAWEGRPNIARGPGKQVILARSDKAGVAFGSRLSPDELRWLKAVIENVITV